MWLKVTATLSRVPHAVSIPRKVDLVKASAHGYSDTTPCSCRVPGWPTAVDLLARRRFFGLWLDRCCPDFRLCTLTVQDLSTSFPRTHRELCSGSLTAS